ncbi:MAG: metallophosphatase family protein [Desulfurococcales archaeon]|nr:metallophosphatase family protein [Desulfurococcales archaeon]
MSRILVISDIHGNLDSLSSVINFVNNYDEVIVLGDLVDYGPEPGEVIDRLREAGARFVRGNHDDAVGFGRDCRCGEKTHWVSLWFRENITNKILDETDKEFLRNLPGRLSLEIDNMIIEAVHGSPASPLYGYLHPDLGDREMCSVLRPSLRLKEKSIDNECPNGKVFLVGHTHIQFLRIVKGALVANPGSVGQPRDGDPRAGYLIINTDTGTFTFGRVKYDVERVIRKLRDLGIPDPYYGFLAQLLRTGIVPPRPCKNE